MFLDYLIRLTVLSLHHGYTLYISHDYCLYYISFVYLKSFKELFLISKLPFVSESVCKGKRFFLNHQIFSKFFFEKIFQRSETGTGSPSRSLSTAKVRYKATPEKTGNLTFTLSMLYCVSLSKAGAKLRTFSQTPTFTRLFFDRFSKFFRKTLENRYVTRHIFLLYTEGGGKHAQ